MPDDREPGSGQGGRNDGPRAPGSGPGRPPDDWFLRWLDGRFQSMERGVEELRHESREARVSSARAHEIRFTDLEKNKADATTVRLLALIVFGFVGMILVGFASAWVSGVLDRPSIVSVPK